MSSTPLQIFVAEDDPVIRDVLCMALQDEGYEVEYASNGATAFERISQWKPNLILLDMMLPEMDGWTILERLRRDSMLRTIPIVIISASWKVRGQRNALGVEAVFEKPFDLTGVLEEVATIAARASSSD